MLRLDTNVARKIKEQPTYSHTNVLPMLVLV